MFDHIDPLAARPVILASLLVVAGALAVADTAKAGEADYTAMSPEELAKHLIFEKKGFQLDQKTQEGGTVKERLTQDDIQKACSIMGGATVDAKTADNVRTIAQKSTIQPKGGIKLGDWKKGEAVARSGYGYRVGHKVDDHGKKDPGGNCYACHQLDPDEIAYGTLGPSLKGYGKARGTSDAILKYTYGVIYHPHAVFPCTQMPRFGANKVLTHEQIVDVMAYLMDPDSPVNR
jgi:sulfur-oxidizing protein SoxX